MMIKNIILSFVLCSITTIHNIRTSDLQVYEEALLFDYQISTPDATNQEWAKIIDKTHNFLHYIEEHQAEFENDTTSQVKLITELGSYVQSATKNLNACSGTTTFQLQQASNISTKNLEHFFTVEHYNNLIVIRGALLKGNQSNQELWLQISEHAQELIELSAPHKIVAFTSKVIEITNLAHQDNFLQFAIGIY